MYVPIIVIFCTYYGIGGNKRNVEVFKMERLIFTEMMKLFRFDDNWTFYSQNQKLGKQFTH